jgi:2-polyprenyl-6-methoxyphenol hydroxylase-like FAD-dependent oxidoreductase
MVEWRIPMRVLLVGGGIAGLTLAAKLRQQGREPVVVEKAAEYTDVGYSIGLYPLGSCVLHGLGVYDDFVARGLSMQNYEIADHTGKVLQHLDVSVLTDNIGPIIMLARYELIDVLRKACGDLPIRMGTTVRDLEQAGDTVQVALSDGTRGEYDLVVLCDGIHSSLREQVFGPCDVFDTGWTVWSWWGSDGLFSPELVREYWGSGWMFGSYPVRGKRMCCAGLPTKTTAEANNAAEKVVPILRSTFAELTDGVPAVRQAFDQATNVLPWPMTDVRMTHWSTGRVALCGDAGMAFLPTAGIGASSAMRSAAALADELSRADAQLAPLALELYEKRCYKLVRGNQDDSRHLARMMFVQSKALGWTRDQLIKHMSAGRFLQSIIKSMHEPF